MENLKGFMYPASATAKCEQITAAIWDLKHGHVV